MAACRVVFEQGFRRDYKRVVRQRPHLRREFEEVVSAVVETGAVPVGYHPHELVNPGGNHTGHWEFHLSDGEVDVLVIYVEHKTNPAIRFVRMGSHSELFQGRLG